MNRAAQGSGFTIGQALADARALMPNLLYEEEEPSADKALLQSIADWADRYTPLVALDRLNEHIKPTGTTHHVLATHFRYGIFLDLTGCIHLFRSKAKVGESAEEALLRDIKTKLNAHGLHVQMGLADTAGAAWAISRFGTFPIIPLAKQKQALLNLPLAALRIQPEIEGTMYRVGLKRIHQIINNPRGPLAARFGLELIRRLDQALGDEEETISPRLPVPDLMAEKRFFNPISLMDDIKRTIASLSETMAVTLYERGEGARHLLISLFHTDGKVTRIETGTSAPIIDASHMARLFTEKLSQPAMAPEPGFGFDIVRLSVLVSERTKADQINLSGTSDNATELTQLIDRLSARIGEENVTHLIASDSHNPEEAASFVSALHHGLQDKQVENTSSHMNWHIKQAAEAIVPERPSDREEPLDRPIRLFRRPEPIQTVAEVPEGAPRRFIWRKATYNITRSEGPERISTPWWEQDGLNEDGTPAKTAFTRDYYRVEDKEGIRFWIFRNGLYERETNAPSWFMHGLFA